MGYDVEERNRSLEGAPPQEALRWAVENYPGDRLALLSSFGPEDVALIHLLHEVGPRVPVVFIDTLHHFPETLELVERVRARYDLDLRVYRPAPTLEEFEARYGERLWERDVDRYQEVSKVEPFREATAGLDAWITGRRREQAPTRAHLPVIEWGEQVKVNPLVTWTRGDVWNFILEHGIPYNPLHDQGYASIGDAPLTTPVVPGEDERAGRWRGQGKTECGIHFA